MNFQSWFKKRFKSKFAKCIQDEAMEIGWYFCKKEILEILNKRHDSHKKHDNSDVELVIKDIIDEIKKKI